jgi:hypothetical protein
MCRDGFAELEPPPPRKEDSSDLKERFSFDYDISNGWCWRQPGKDILTTTELAEMLVKEFAPGRLDISDLVATKGGWNKSSQDRVVLR